MKQRCAGNAGAEAGARQADEAGGTVCLISCRNAFVPGIIRRTSGLLGEHELPPCSGFRLIVRDALATEYQGGAAGLVVRQALQPSSAPTASPTTHLSYSPVKTIADIQRCHEFRLTIEPAAAFRRRAAMRPRSGEDRLGACRSPKPRAISCTGPDADFNFHRAVTEAANNHYYIASIDALSLHRGRHASPRVVLAGAETRPRAGLPGAQRHLQGHRGRPRRGGATRCARISKDPATDCSRAGRSICRSDAVLTSMAFDDLAQAGLAASAFRAHVDRSGCTDPA